MKKPTIEQMNSVIAEFSGTLEIFNDNKKGKIKLYHNEEINSNIGYEIHELKYYTSFDWLYSVWIKILNENIDEKIFVKFKTKQFSIGYLFAQGEPIIKIHKAIYELIILIIKK